MGYRLNISKYDYDNDKCEDVFYGTKVYGYVDTDKLQSFEWLVDNGFLKQEDSYCFGYGYEGNIIMTIGDFKEFAQCYNEDCNVYFCSSYDFKKDYFINLPEIQQLLLLPDSNEIVLSWY